MGDGTVKDAGAVKAVVASNEQPQAKPIDQAVTAAKAQALEQAKSLGYDDVKFQVQEFGETMRTVNMTFVKDGKDIQIGAGITLTGNHVETAEGLGNRFGAQLSAAVREKHAQYGPKVDQVVTTDRPKVTTATPRNQTAGLEQPTAAKNRPAGRRDTSAADRRWVRPNLRVATAIGAEVTGTSNAQKQKSAGDIVEGVQKDLQTIGLYNFEIDRKGGDITMGTKGPGGVMKFTESMTKGGAKPEEMHPLLGYAAANADAYKAAGDDQAKLTEFVTGYREGIANDEPVDKAKKADKAEKADNAVEKADKAVEKTDKAVDKADEAVDKADEAVEKADEAVEKADEAVEKTEIGVGGDKPISEWTPQDYAATRAEVAALPPEAREAALAGLQQTLTPEQLEKFEPSAPAPEQLGGAKQYAKDYEQLPVGTGQAFTQQLGVLQRGLAHAKAQAELGRGAEETHSEIAALEQAISGMKDAASSKLSTMANDGKETQANAFLMQLQSPTLAGEIAGSGMVKIGDDKDSDDFLRAIDAGLQKSPEFAAGFAAGAGENVVENMRVALLTGSVGDDDRQAFANISLAMLNNPEIALPDAARSQLMGETVKVLDKLGNGPAMERIQGLDTTLGVELAMKIDTSGDTERMRVADFLASVPPDGRTAEMTDRMATLLEDGIGTFSGGLSTEAAWLTKLAETEPQLAAQLTQSIMTKKGDSSWNDNLLRSMIGTLGDNAEYVQALATAEVPEGESALARIDTALLDDNVGADDRAAYLTFMKTLWANSDAETRGQIQERLIHQFTDESGDIRIGREKSDDFAREVIAAFGDDALAILAGNPKLNQTVRTALNQDGLTTEESATVRQLQFLDFVTQNWEDANDRMSLLNSQGPTGTPQRAAIDAKFDELLAVAADSMPEERAARFCERFGVPTPAVRAATRGAIAGAAMGANLAAAATAGKGTAQTTLTTMLEQHGTIVHQGEDKGISVTEPGVKRPSPRFEIRDGKFHCLDPYAEYQEPMTPAQFQTFVERMVEQEARLAAEAAGA